MTIAFRMVNCTIKSITRTACVVDDIEISRVPLRGPLILAVNHINFLDVPVMYTHLQPREITALVKEETWNNPIMGALFSLWGGIPIKRGENDITAFSKALQSLKEGKILAISPEGTRSRTGILQQGHPGIAMLAQKANVPIQPVAIYGGEVIWDNLNRLVRTPFHIRVGNIFNIDPSLQLSDRSLRQDAADQVMYQIASLLPEKYRGVYRDLSKKHQCFFTFSTSIT
ncbi:MAG: 1-acyl-sn-glycerol-3-phosphate acyltransferase [Anaerolinea sp.]|nr:1-acyl-sn-glycerol-3-phosphate acyltransferase [Anaerolinea sp.]